jgi:hypothetical protein
MQGCPSYLDFKEEPVNKLAVIWKGNQHTFLEHPEIARKAMNKEERNSHVVPLLPWIVHFLPYMRATPLGMREKCSKFQVIFDLSTQTTPNEVVSNYITTTDLEADINFGQAKNENFHQYIQLASEFSMQAHIPCLGRHHSMFLIPKDFSGHHWRLWFFSRWTLFPIHRSCFWI